PAPAWNSHDGAAGTVSNPATGNSGLVYVPKTWKSSAQAIAEYGAACVAPPANWDGTQAAGNYCSEPHEPYLNLIYPAQAMNNNNNPYPVRVGWEAPDAQTYRSKLIVPNSAFPPGTPVTCSNVGPNDPADCTSNNFDVDGGLVVLDLILYGIVYNEGQYG